MDKLCQLSTYNIQCITDVTGGSSPQPQSLLRPATLVQIQGSTFNTGNKYECAKVNNLLWKHSADIYNYLHMPDYY